MPNTEAYAATFALVDTDGSGRISPAELVSLMEALGEPCTPARAQEAVAAMDSDGDNRITLPEFARYMEQTKP
ncbi:EF-hand domain-containing protein [Nocardiopsis coralliicola]